MLMGLKRPLKRKFSTSQRWSQKQTQEALEESRQNYKLLFENSGIPITLVDPQGRILLVNNVGAKNLRFQASDLVGKSLHKLFPKKAAVLYPEVAEDANSKQKNVRRIRIFTTFYPWPPTPRPLLHPTARKK